MSTEKAMGKIRTRARAQKAVAAAIRSAVEERDREWRAALQKAGISPDAEGFLGIGHARDFAPLRKLVRGGT